MTVTVSVNGVDKSYGAVKALRNVSFDLGPGRLSALVGHNGAGKTTLIKLMLGLIHADRGAVRVLGEDPAAGEFSARRQLGYLPENVAFNAALTGRETLAFYARLKQIKPASAWPLLDRVGLMHAADRRVGTYSKGMRQRLGLAQALLGRPRVLLLDEPTTGLDPALRQTFYEILNELRDDGATVLISSHALNELEDRAEHVLIMNRGLLVAQGSLSELRSISQLPIWVSLDLAPGANGSAASVDDRESIATRTAASCWCPMRPARWICCAWPAIPASRTLKLRRPPSMTSMPISGECRVRNIVIIAGKEIKEGLRNRWVLATTLLLAALSLSLTFLGSAPTGNVGAGALDVVVVSLSSLTIFLLPLIALLISHDAVVGEMERGTMILLLSYPVGRYQVMLGKFCGHVSILAFATVIGYAARRPPLPSPARRCWQQAGMHSPPCSGPRSLLGAVFVAIGYLISSLAPRPRHRCGTPVGIWLLMVLVFDMALLGILVIDQGRIISAPVLEALLFLNPTDLYRLTNLTGFNVSQFSGMAGLAGTASMGIGALLLGLLVWIAAPLGLATVFFARREL
jgi:ABC-type multidrug transport system ATPase subunit/ABC-type transport system involved in multi-copper enzyme maturation permease subunit